MKSNVLIAGVVSLGLVLPVFGQSLKKEEKKADPPKVEAKKEAPKKEEPKKEVKKEEPKK